MYDAVILAGGAARRLGGADKPAVEVGGRTLLEHVVAAVRDAAHVVVVGPRRPVAVGGVTWCVENPPGGGPVAAIAAGLASTSADLVLVLAADLPYVAPAVPALLARLDAVPTVDAALLVDASGRVNHLAAAWRRAALVTALAGLGNPAGAPARALIAAVHAVHVPDPDRWGRDCDTWADVDAARVDPPC